MSDRTPYILRAKDSAAITEWSLADAAALEDFNASIKTLGEEMGVKEILTRVGYDGNFITGYIQPDRHVPVPEGWRRESRDRTQVVPALRSAAGKAIAARLRTMSCPAIPVPGLPDLMWGFRVMGVFRLEQHGEHWYAKLGFTPDIEKSKPIDLGLWEEIPLSAYYLAVESVGKDQQ